MTLRSLLPRHWPLWLQLGIPIAAVICLSVALITFLNFFNYQKSYRQLQQTRIQIIGKDIRQSIESGLNIGIPPAANARLDQQLRATLQSSTDLQLISILDESGAAKLHAGLALPPAELSMQQQKGPPPWQSQSSTLYLIGLPYHNSFGQQVGTLVLGYPRSSIDVATAAMRHRLLLAWFFAAIGIFITTLTGVWLLTRKLARELKKAAHAIDHALITPAAPMPALPALGNALADDINELIAVSQATTASLGASARQGGASA